MRMNLWAVLTLLACLASGCDEAAPGPRPDGGVPVGPTPVPCLETGCTVLRTFTGESAGDFFGWVTADVGDIDGDGVHDVVVGAPQNSAGGAGAGRVTVFSGATGATLLTLTGASGDSLGETVGAAGDVDGDGVPDVLAGGPGLGEAQATGMARVYSGRTGAVLHTFIGATPADHLGTALVGLGDVDGDGKGDFLVGARGAGGSGVLTLHSGADGHALYTLAGTAAGDAFGTAAGAVGDLDADGVPDFAVSATGAGPNGHGEVTVRSGKTGALLRGGLTPDSNASELGLLFVGGAGDVNGDGVPDVYATDYEAGNNRGKAYVYSGATGDRLLTLTGAGSEGLGIGHARIGDVNGDGFDDLLVGAYLNSSGAAGAGRVYIFSGRDGSVLRTMTSSIAGEGLGFDAHGLGDVNGDGRTDYVLSAAQNGGNRGKVYIVAGQP